MNILVTGANGQLGRELRSFSSTSHHRFVFTDVSQAPENPVEYLDILDTEAVEAMVGREDVGLIVNCAAYTDVEKAEDEPEKAMRLNADAPAILAAAAKRKGAVLIHISTDYVFSGNGCAPLREDYPTGPASVYGKTKLAGEEAIRTSGCEYIILRTAWLYSPYGKNFVKTILGLASGRKELNVVCDQVGSPTAAADLAAAIMHIVGSGQIHKCGIYHFTDEGAISWFDLAAAICRLAGLSCEVHPCRSSQFPTKARRPAYSVLDKTLFTETFGMRPPWWFESLDRNIRRIAA